MQIWTTHGSQIRTSTGSKIHTGRSIIHFGSEMAFGTYKKSSGFMDTINADMNGEYDQPQKQPQDQTGTSDLNNVLSEDGKQLYSMLKKSDKRKYQNYYNRLRSRQQWVRYESENGTFTRQKKQGGSQINVAGGSATRKGGTTAKRTAQKTAQGVIRTTEKSIATTTKTVTKVTAGAATFGAGTVVMAAADAAVTTGKATAKTARKVIQSMQQQTVQSMQEQQAVTAAESRSAAQDEERKKETSQSSMVLVLFAAFVAVMVIISSFTAVGITIKQSQDSQGNQTGQVCTKIAEAELSDADTTVGGYRYKNWYGMDDNWCAMFVSYCADKCGFIEAGIMPKTASVAAMKQWYISHGLFQTVSSGYKPKAGDIIIFGNGMSHTGIVTGYDDETKTVTTIEGNSGRSSTTPYHKGSHVKEHHYPLSYAKIVGYGTPQYPSDDSSQIENQTTVQTGEM